MLDAVAEPLDVLRRAVATGLPGAAPHDADGPLTLTTDVLAIAGNQRVQGLVWSALRAGRVVAPEEVIDKACEAYLNAVRKCLLAESWGD